jgi:transforming growth factor-beta-induced protein
MKNILKAAFRFSSPILPALLITSALLMGCQKDKANQPTPAKNVVQTLGEKPEFSTLTVALVKTGLDRFLGSPTEQVTVFAPTNAAFSLLPAPFTDVASVSAITDSGQVAQLRTLLSYHIVNKKVNAADIASGNTQLPILINNQKLRFAPVSKTAQGLFINGNAKVVTPDIQASNGVIHGIDHVIVP